jgi:hypothetical protein
LNTDRPFVDSEIGTVFPCPGDAPSLPSMARDASPTDCHGGDNLLLSPLLLGEQSTVGGWGSRGPAGSGFIPRVSTDPPPADRKHTVVGFEMRGEVFARLWFKSVWLMTRGRGIRVLGPT